MSWRYLLVLFSIGVFAGNAQPMTDSGISVSPICQHLNASELVDIQLLSQWRSDQKQPKERLLRAEEIIWAWAENTDCINLQPNDDHRVVSHLIIITIYELGPHFTLSLPILWSGHTEVKFRVEIKSVREDKLIASNVVHATEGGAFNIRTLEDAYREFGRQLHEIVLEED
jgi:hypothetical protein